MLFNKIKKNNVNNNKFRWKFEYEDTVYKVYDRNNDLAGYFFPNYNLVEEQSEARGGNGKKHKGEEDEVIEDMNKLHENVRGGNLMIPMLRLNLLDNEARKEGMD